ncbi:MAG TPA: hypothetical protein VFV10_04150 [Gammaproteobacteria bacterium]|jgi:hypothetical protein|nr:hypothetical protein [Gammaproteobacteria bacterium]
MKAKILLAGIAALPFAAQADGFDYTYVEGGYLSSSTDVGPFSVDGDGLGIRGSFGLNDTLNLFADYSTEDFDFGVSTSAFDVGAGGHWGLKDNLDFVGEVAWIRLEADSGNASASDDGLGVSGGLRYRANDKVELQGMLNYADVSDSDTSFGFSGRYYFSKAFALGAGLLFNDGDTAWNIGVRAGFKGH